MEARKVEVCRAARSRARQCRDVPKETYREQREQHPGGDHDLTVPQVQPDLQNQLLLKLRPVSLSTAGHARSGRSPLPGHRLRVQRDRAGTPGGRGGTWWAWPQEAHRLQRDPAPLLRFKGTLWPHLRAFKGKGNTSRVCGIYFLHSD